jgi:hypothetical protein
MKNIFLSAALATGMLFALPAWSSFLGIGSNSCDDASETAKPDWIKDGYGETNNYIGVGWSAKPDKSERQHEAETLATQHLTDSIKVETSSVNEQSTSMSNQRVKKDALSKMTVRSKAVLRDLHTKDHWVDKETCTLYILKVANKKAADQANLLATFKEKLDEGTNRDKTPSVNDRRGKLEDAQLIFPDINFALFPDEDRKIYDKQLKEAFAAIVKESSQSKDRMALFVLNKDGRLKGSVIGKMVDQLRTSDQSIERLMENCEQEYECKKIAKDQGFTKLTMLYADCQVGVSQMGSLKGKLTVTKKIYDLDSREILDESHAMSAEVIGWSNEELDWNAAAEKVMQGLK